MLPRPLWPARSGCFDEGAGGEYYRLAGEEASNEEAEEEASSEEAEEQNCPFASMDAVWCGGRLLHLYGGTRRCGGIAHGNFATHVGYHLFNRRDDRQCDGHLCGSKDLWTASSPGSRLIFATGGSGNSHKKSFARIYQPLIADMREEHAEALLDGRPGWARFVHCRWVLIFVLTMIAHSAAASAKVLKKIYAAH
jgi:hypothetical protein